MPARTGTYVALAAIAVGGFAIWQTAQSPPPAGAPRTAATESKIEPGGSLVGTVRSEPSSFNRYVSRDSTTDIFALLTQAKLLRVNRVTQEIEPWLAERWTASPDGLSYELTLRDGIAFSDGTVFSSDDVVFAFETIYDERTGSPLRDALLVDGRPLEVSAHDRRVILIKFPAPYGPGLRILDGLPILPKHRLAEARRSGALGSAWGTSTAPSEIAGLGPFVLKDYRPGERLLFARNPRYWRRDADGVQLPYLDQLTLEIVPDQSAELLRLEAGQTDFTQSELRPEDYLPLKRAAADGRVRMWDLGIGLDADALWFSLNPALKANDPRRPWLQSDDFRRAISLAVNRAAFVDTVFLGAGVPLAGPVTPGNAQWFLQDLPATPYDPARARSILSGLGLAGGAAGAIVNDRRDQPVRFSVLAVKGNTAAERGAAVIREDLARIGIVVDVVALEFGALVERLVKGDFDALYFRLQSTDSDPAINLDFWMSSGSAHVWHIGQQTPATDWERQIDDLMQRQARSLNQQERKRLFDEVQRIFVRHSPGIFFAAPRVFVATSARVANATPALLRPQLLWNAETLAAGRRSSATH